MSQRSRAQREDGSKYVDQDPLMSPECKEQWGAKRLLVTKLFQAIAESVYTRFLAVDKAELIKSWTA